jgi:hypothetical protein
MAMLCAIGLGVLVASAWPSSPNKQLSDTYNKLRESPVPVLVIVPQEVRETQAEVSANQYLFRLQHPETGQIDVIGSLRAPAEHNGGTEAVRQQTWTADGFYYTVRVPARVSDASIEGIRNGLKPLDHARQELFGFAWDTPLLYLGYLPGLVVFTGFIVARLIGQLRALAAE